MVTLIPDRVQFSIFFDHFIKLLDIAGGNIPVMMVLNSKLNYKCISCAYQQEILTLTLMEDGTLSRKSNAYTVRRQSRLQPTSRIAEILFVIVCNCNVKKEIKLPYWAEKP
jgi:hypothetical protein